MAVKRLIETFVPENYQIALDINREKKEFKGHVVVTGLAKERRLFLHEKGLEILTIQFEGKDLSYQVNDAAEEIEIQLPRMGEVTLSIAYTGRITDNMMGIYPSYYEVEGVKKMLIGTQFESHFARQAFPSIDEPEAKATFDLSVKFDEVNGEIVISNMPEIACEDGFHKFERTVKMSSYLLAFILGDLQYKKGKTKSGVEVGAFSTKAHSESVLDFPLDIAIRAIDFYEDYYQTPYPLPHSWHVALPDFSAGAMENWGCITYREVCMLVDPENATASSKQYVATVIAHELAHQWFGDLVTMRWWDDLWLNESFANNMEYVAIDAIEPSWHAWEQFSMVETNLALNRDATDGVQSVHVEVTHPDEINTLFDPAIVYAKGSRLMVMLRKWLGDPAFAQGLRVYFERHQYGNTTGEDLWRALSETSGQDVSSFMHSWINQPGYPVLDVELKNGVLTLGQRQFFIGEHKEAGRLWEIPLNSNYENLPSILSDRQIEISNFKLEAGRPLLLNDQNAAHYIVNYKGELLSEILSNLTSLDEITKFQILQDRRYLAKGGIIGYAELIKLLPYYQNEDSYIVNQGLNQLFADLELFIEEGTPVEAAYQGLVRRIFLKNYQRLGWKKTDDESSDDESLRGLVLSRMLGAEDQGAVSAAAKIYEKYRQASQNISADIRPMVLANQVKQENALPIVEHFLKEYRATSAQEYKRELSAAIANVKQKPIIEKILALFEDAETIKPQDLASWYLSLMRKDAAQAIAWKWARDHWVWLKEKLGGDMSFDHFVVYTAQTLKTSAGLTEFRQFFEPKLGELGLKRNILMGISSVQARVNLIEGQKRAVEVALLEVSKEIS